MLAVEVISGSVVSIAAPPAAAVVAAEVSSVSFSVSCMNGSSGLTGQLRGIGNNCKQNPQSKLKSIQPSSVSRDIHTETSRSLDSRAAERPSRRRAIPCALRAACATD